MSSVNDPIADLLTRVRNAITASHETLELPSSKVKVEVARILKEQGYINGYEVKPARVGQTLTVQLRYNVDRRSAIAGIQRVSTPGRRTYVGKDEIPRVLGGMGTTILTTSRGLMTGHDAKKAGIGGELLAKVW